MESSGSAAGVGGSCVISYLARTTSPNPMEPNQYHKLTPGEYVVKPFVMFLSVMAIYKGNVCEECEGLEMGKSLPPL